MKPIYIFRFQPAPRSIARKLVVYAADYEAARDKAEKRLAEGYPNGQAILLPHSPDVLEVRLANLALRSGLLGTLCERDLREVIADWQAERDAKGIKSVGRKESSFDSELRGRQAMFRKLDLEKALADPNSPQALARIEAQRKTEQEELNKAERRAENLRKERRAAKNSSESKNAALQRERRIAKKLVALEDARREEQEIRKSVRSEKKNRKNTRGHSSCGSRSESGHGGGVV